MKVGVGDGCGALDNDNGRRLISKKIEQTKKGIWVGAATYIIWLFDRPNGGCVVLTNDS
jgi:hypothetical protein